MAYTKAEEFIDWLMNTHAKIPMSKYNVLDGITYPEMWKNLAEQDIKEFEVLLDIVKEKNVKRILEIGSFKMGTLLGFDSVIKDGLLVSVDNNELSWRKRVLRWNNKLELITGDSADPKVIEKIRAYGPFDLAFIDGCHDGIYPRKDWETCKSISKIVAFHDIEVPSIKPLWEEIKFKHENTVSISLHRFEPVNHTGIGVVFL
jgi:predicted O-methyltransferase YrrM